MGRVLRNCVEEHGYSEAGEVNEEEDWQRGWKIGLEVLKSQEGENF